MTTLQRRLSTFRASITAVNSMRLFVVWASPPHISRSWGPLTIQTPHPPRPGLPLHAPSVYITTVGIVESLIHSHPVERGRHVGDVVPQRPGLPQQPPGFSSAYRPVSCRAHA